jgi:hypothetical protein
MDESVNEKVIINILQLNALLYCNIKTSNLFTVCHNHKHSYPVTHYKLLPVLKYKVVQIRPGQTVTCLHTISPGHN